MELISFESLLQKKVVSPDKIGEHARKLKNEGKSIVFINGAFDVLHKGHLHILFEAKEQGDVLIVAVNTDDSIRRSKGEHRPINPLADRIEMLSALQMVSFVTWFEQKDPRAILMDIQPDTHVNGSEYGVDCLEAQTLKDIGARLHIVQLLEGSSSTNLIKKMSLCV